MAFPCSLVLSFLPQVAGKDLPHSRWRFQLGVQLNLGSGCCRWHHKVWKSGDICQSFVGLGPLPVSEACFKKYFFSHPMSSRFTGMTLSCFSDKDSLSLLEFLACIWGRLDVLMRSCLCFSSLQRWNTQWSLWLFLHAKWILCFCTPCS